MSSALESKLDHLGVGYDPNRAPKSQKVADLLAEMRRHGLARTVGDPLPGVNAFAAPVFDYAGHVALVITATGTFDARRESPIAKALRTGAACWAATIRGLARVGRGDQATPGTLFTPEELRALC